MDRFQSKRAWIGGGVLVVAVIVAAESASARAMPKSMTLTSPLPVSITLAGLMSRCTMPPRWE